jgi:hypothetical protein
VSGTRRISLDAKCQDFTECFLCTLALLENPHFSYVIVSTHHESVSMTVHKDAFWHDFDNISKWHDIRHAYIVSSFIEILFEHATEIISKRHEVRHDLMHHYCQDTQQYVSNNVYSHVKIPFDMIVKKFQNDEWLDMIWIVSSM